jgi:hypothetical protein
MIWLKPDPLVDESTVSEYRYGFEYRLRLGSQSVLFGVEVAEYFVRES